MIKPVTMVTMKGRMRARGESLNKSMMSLFLKNLFILKVLTNRAIYKMPIDFII